MDAAKAGGGPDTIKKVSQASGISNGTVGRIVTGEVATTVDQLAALAQTFGLQAWQLLQPGATSHAHQQAAPSWPLSKVEPERYLALSLEDRGFAQAQFRAIIEELHGAATPPGAARVGTPAAVVTSGKRQRAA